MLCLSTLVPAAIAALMGAVPPEQAGVGSALNDTIQQLGAALGVAILGSVLTSGYTASMPASAPESARRSVTDALGEPGLAEPARDAFTSAMSTTFLLSAVGVLAAAVLAFLMLRSGTVPDAGGVVGEDVAELGDEVEAPAQVGVVVLGEQAGGGLEEVVEKPERLAGASG